MRIAKKNYVLLGKLKNVCVWKPNFNFTLNFYSMWSLWANICFYSDIDSYATCFCLSSVASCWGAIDLTFEFTFFKRRFLLQFSFNGRLLKHRLKFQKIETYHRKLKVSNDKLKALFPTLLPAGNILLASKNRLFQRNWIILHFTFNA